MEEVVKQDRKQVLLAEARRRRIAWINADEPSECEVTASVNAAGKGSDVGLAKKRANVTALFKDATGLETLLPLARDYIARLNELAGEVDKEVVEYMPQPTVVDESQTGDEAEYPRYEYGIPHYEIVMRKLRHPAAAELVKAMQRFVQQFIERQSTVKETGQHVSHPGGSSADSVHLFLQNMETEMHKNVLWSEELGPQWEDTRECLEKFIMTKLRRHLFTAPEAAELSKRDQALSERLSALAFVGPEHLDLKSLQRETVDALKPAVWEMRGVSELKSPKDMIDCLLDVAKHITRQLLHARDGGSFGADDFLPAMILVVKEANPSKLHSTLEVIQRYRHPSKLVSEAGYIFAHVVSAVHFLETADASQLSISQEALEAHLQRVTPPAADGEQSTLANVSDDKAMDTSSSTPNSRGNTSLNMPSTSSEAEAQPSCFQPRSIQDVRRERALYRQEVQETTAPPWLELLADTRLSYFGWLGPTLCCRDPRVMSLRALRSPVAPRYGQNICNVVDRLLDVRCTMQHGVESYEDALTSPSLSAPQRRQILSYLREGRVGRIVVGSLVEGAMSFWRQFKVLTWKNTLLRRRHIATWLIEVAVPVILTLGMVGIYGTIKQKVQPASIPGVAYTTAFDEYYRNFGKATCTDLYDSTVFWRCNIEDCDPKKCEYLALAVAPYTSTDARAVAVARALHAHINTRVNGSLSTKLFASNDELDHYITRPDYPASTTQQRIGAAVVFESGPPTFKYHLRFNKTVNAAFQYLLPPTDLTTDPLLRDGGESPKACGRLCWQTYLNMYFYSGALAVQNLVDEFVMSDAVGERVRLRSNVVEFPAPSFKSAGFWGSIASFYGVFMVIAILYPVSNIVRSLVVEKELKIREGMKMMSLRDSALYASWAFHHATTFTIIAVLILATGGKLFQHSNGLLILLYYLLFFYSTTAFAFFMSTFFSRSRTAAVLGILPYFAGYFITMALKDDATRQQKLLACLHPSSAFTLAMQAFIDWEDSGIGVTRYTWRTSPSGNSTFTFADALGMMLIDIFVYALLTWYNDKVWPSEFGTRLPPWFFWTHAYWKRVFPKCYQHRRREVPTDVEEALASELTPDVERVPDCVAQQIKEGSCVYIRGLRKEFDTNTGNKVAVDDLNLTMYASHITALLGPNGAGKTTTVSLLTGLLHPTSGTALIAGKDIYTDMSEIQQQLGVCPQHDVLFPDLTVEEHLMLYAALKGVPKTGLAAAAEQMIAEVGLMDKRKVPAKKLSGGMRRKLSVAIAFIGDPKVVFLDEPTTGMDPYSRRSTWSLIRKYREGRVIIFSTHFMDEADVLADRIAIMSKGGLRACGTSLFLKNHFNCGYTLVVERAQHTDVTRIERFICSRVPQAKVLSSVGAEVSFQLPLSASPSFKALFDDMDARQERLGVVTYGVSVTTLEQVFLKIARGEETGLVDRTPSKASIDGPHKALSYHSTGDSLRVASYDSLNEEGKFVDVELCNMAQSSMGEGTSGVAEKVTVAGGPGTAPNSLGVDHFDNWRFFRRHMQALLIKRMLYFSRDRKAWVFQFITPALFVLLGSALMKAGTKNNILNRRLPLLPLTLDAYNPGITHFPNPTFYSEQGTLFDQAVAASPGQYRTKSWVQDANVTGQQAIMEAIPSHKDLPAVPVDAPGVHNMSEQLLSTRADWRASRYGAFSFASISHDAGQHTYEYNVHVNYTGVHAAPIYTSIVNSAILRSLLPSASISAVMGQLPATKSEHSTAASFEGFPTVILIMLAFCFIPAAFAVFVVRERETKAKHLQIVSGVTYMAYWLSTWLFDFFSYQIPLWLTVLILVCFDAKALIRGDAFAATVMLFLLWGASASSFTYLTSFMFTRHSMAQVSAIFLNFVSGLILVIVTVIMTFIETTRPLLYQLVFLFRLTPSFCLGNGLINVIFAPLWGMVDGERYTVWSLKISGWNLIYMAIEAVGFFLLTLAVDHLSWKPFFANCRQSMGGQLSGSPVMEVLDDDKDVDVLKEQQRVKSSHNGQDVVVLKGLHKIYPGGKAAVQALSLGIPKGECFGLLGVNGAGKTTTLSILTGEFPPSAGDVILGGFNITENPGVVRRLVGYCPQFDALFDLLTGREHLQLYARVKGLDERQVKMVVDGKIGEMDLSEYANRIASTYSGGNKRKLSVAMAMIGRPLIVFLDEPSSGMDPVARRFMWQVISDITTKRGECCVILTTHSMEEAEALCTRVGIMVGGRLRCLGSTQHIKSRHGLGYQVELSVQLPSPADISKATEQLACLGDHGGLSHGNVNKALDLLGHGAWSTRISAHGSGADVWHSLSGGSGVIAARDLASWCVLEERVDAVQAFVEQRCPGAVLRERQGNKVRYGVPLRGMDDQTRRLSDMFGDIEAAKQTLHVADYSVSQTSLEQIFNLIAAQWEEHHDR